MAIREEKEITGIQIGKEELKLSLLADDMILYTENPKDVIRKLLEFLNEFGKVAGYKINTQKSLTFLYTNNERPEREVEETIPISIASKRIKYLGINLPKEAKDLYSEKYKVLMKEIKMTKTDGGIYHAVGLEESILSKRLYYTKQSTDSMQSLSNGLSMALFTELEQNILQFVWKHKRPKKPKKSFFFFLTFFLFLFILFIYFFPLTHTVFYFYKR